MTLCEVTFFYVMAKGFDTVVMGAHDPVWWFILIIPNKEAKKFIPKGTSTGRALCSLNKNEAFQAAIMPKGDGSYFININKERRKSYGIDKGDEVHVVLSEDFSKYGLPMPEEFQEILNQDPEGDKFFHSLTPGKQRSLLHIIGKPKSVDLRIHKGFVILNYLKRAQGKLDFKELILAMKEANRLR